VANRTPSPIHKIIRRLIMKYLLLNRFGGFPTPGTVHRFLPVVDKLHT
jgi:hypothetical protein